MSRISRRSVLQIAALAAAIAMAPPALSADNVALSSWADGGARARIVDFVTATTTEGGANFVEPSARIHHDDAEREYAYDRESAFGRLVRGLDEGPKRGWVLTSMKSDWKCVFAFQCAQ